MEAIDPVDGWTVNRVEVEQLGEIVQFRYLGGRAWVVSRGDEPMTETTRDADRIELRDARNRRAVIDLQLKKLLSDFGASSRLWDAGEIRRATAEPDGVLVTRIEVQIGRGRGWFRQVATNRWEEYGADGVVPRFTFEVLERTEHAITLRDASRGYTLVFDLASMRSFIQQDGGERHPLYRLNALGYRSRPSDQGDRPTQLTFTNPTTFTLDVLWVDFVGNERPRFTLEPGDTRSTTTYAGHRWVVREIESRRRLESTFAAPTPTALTITTDDLRPLGGPGVEVVVKNLHVHPIELHPVRSDGSTDQPATIAPGGHESFSASVGDVFRCRSEGEDNGVVLVGAKPAQYRRVTRGPSRAPDTSLRIINTTPLRVDVLLEVGGGAPIRFHTLEPGEQVDQPAVSGERWLMHDSASRRLAYSVAATEDDATAAITTVALRSQRQDQLAAHEPGRQGVRMVTRNFRNQSSLDCVLHRVEPTGAEDEGVVIGAGVTLTGTAPIGTVWRARERTTGREVAVHIADDSQDVDVDVSVRTRHSRTPLELTIENRTLLHAEIFWVDGAGVEVSRGFLAPWAKATCSTFATHAWVLREPVTRTVLDVHIAAPSRTTMLLDTTDLTRIRTETVVEVEFHNVTGFDCEVVDVADLRGAALATFVPGADGSIMARAGQSLAFREPLRGSVFATMTCSSEPHQFVQITPTGPTHGSSTTVVLDNTSTVDIAAYEFKNGAMTDRGTVDPWTERAFATEAGAVWHFCEARSGVTYALVMATGTPRHVYIEADLVRSKEGQVPVELTVTNVSGIDLEAQAMAPDGSWTSVGTILSGASQQRTSFFSEVTRFVVPGTELEVDRAVTTDESPFEFLVHRHLVAHGIPPDGLRQGEVAVYPERDFAGTPTVVHCDLDDLAAVGITTVGSIQVGRATAVIVSRSGGGDAVFYVDTPTLDGTAVAGGVDTLEIVTTTPSAQCADNISVELTTSWRIEPSGDETPFPSYRTVMTFDHEVGAVELWATAQLDVCSGDVLHSLGPTVPIVRTPTSAGTLTLDVPAEQRGDGSARFSIGTPALMVRTNAMPPDQVFFVHPDRSAMQRLRDAPDDDLWNRVVSPTASGSSSVSSQSGLTEDACSHVMRALRQVAAAAPCNGNENGRRAPVEARSMEYDAWSVDRESGAGPRFKPLDIERAAAVPVGRTPANLEGPQFFAALVQAVRDFDRIVVRPVAKEANRVMTSIDRAAQDVGTALYAVGQAIDDEIVTPAIHFVEEELVPSVVSAVDQTVDAVGQAIDDSVDLLTDVVDTASAAVEAVDEIVLALTVEVGNQVETLVIDTAEKVAATVTAIVEEVGIAINEVVDFLSMVLDWDSVKKTHDLIIDIVTQMPELLTSRGGLLDQGESVVETGIGQIRSEITALLDVIRNDVGAIAPADGDPVRPPSLPELPSPDWLIDRLVSAIDAETTTAQGDLAALTAQLGSFDTLLGSGDGEASSSGEAALGRLIAGVEGLLGAPPEQAGPRLLGLALAVLEEILTGALDAVAGVVGALFDVLRTVVGEVFRALATTQIDVPVISGLYIEHVSRSENQPMTPLGLAAIMIAFPTSVVGRAMVGERWPVSNAFSIASDAEILRRALAVGVHGFRVPVAPAVLTLPDPAPMRATLLAIDLLPEWLLMIADVSAEVIPASVGSAPGPEADPSAFINFMKAIGWISATVAFVGSNASSLLTASRTADAEEDVGEGSHAPRHRRRRKSSRRRRRSDPAKRWDSIAGSFSLLSSFAGLAGTVSAASSYPDSTSVGAIVYNSSRVYLDIGAVIGSFDGPVTAQRIILVTGNLAAATTLAVGISEL